jgi:hypothetical protein
MRVEQRSFRAGAGWDVAGGALRDAGLVLVFGSSAALRDSACLADLHHAYPEASLFGCSTAGEISGVRVSDETVVATALHFAQTTVRHAVARVTHPRDSFAAGSQVAGKLAGDGLTHVLVLSDGLHVNGTELVRGISEALPPSVSVTGGLAGDGARFEHTWVLVDGVPSTEAVAAVGFYGNHLHVGCASQGGWDPFGPERLVTRSDGNVLYELDGKSALDLYKRYLGEHSRELPASGLLFPLSLRTPRSDTRVVRTILSVNEADGSMSFAGDIPSGAYAQLMKANFDRLVDGAIGAARSSVKGSGALSPDLAILVSCVGRKLVLKQRIEEELEGVRGVMGKRTVLAGFYSYGEISPFTRGGRVELHNQTMTITAVSER